MIVENIGTDASYRITFNRIRDCYFGSVPEIFYNTQATALKYNPLVFAGLSKAFHVIKNRAVGRIPIMGPGAMCFKIDC